MAGPAMSGPQARPIPELPGRPNSLLKNPEARRATICVTGVSPVKITERTSQSK
jgi:hypothetical protein